MPFRAKFWLTKGTHSTAGAGTVGSTVGVGAAVGVGTIVGVGMGRTGVAVGVAAGWPQLTTSSAIAIPVTSGLLIIILLLLAGGSIRDNPPALVLLR
jgi:hypothetical protein